MFPVAELQEKGAKRAVLEYLASELPQLPIPESLVVTKARPGAILRSDHWREFDSFYGIFESAKLGSELIPPEFNWTGTFTHLAQALAYVRFQPTTAPWDSITARKRELFNLYCKQKSLDPEHELAGLKIFPQQIAPSRTLGTIIALPNKEQRFLLYSDLQAFEIDASDQITVNRIEIGMGTTTDIGQYQNQVLSDWHATRSDIDALVESFQTVLALPRFQDGRTYMMEFGLSPLSVLQVRAFRERMSAPYDCAWKDQTGVAHTPLVFGITPPEGIIVPYYSGSLLPGPNFRHKLTREVHEYNEAHPEGFALDATDVMYANTFFPNARVGLYDTLAHGFHHGSAESMATLPLALFNVKHALHASVEKGGLGAKHDDMLRIFSNGHDAYVQLIR